MSDHTGIAWTDATWNPVTGCTKVSAGCRHCYAERDWPRFHGRSGRPFTHVLCHEDRLAHPIRWQRPRKIFVNSMSDLFHEDVPVAFIDQVFAVMAVCRRHTFQVLTKRPERMQAYLVDEHAHDRILTHAIRISGEQIPTDWPLPNVWLGVSVEDQASADQRAPWLLHTPAAVRFVSAEPLLDAVDLRRYLAARCPCGQVAPCDRHHNPQRPRVDWVIVGGESGHGARPMQAVWLNAIKRQCLMTRVPLFIKQLGTAYSDPENGIAGHNLRIREEGLALLTRRLAHRSGANPEEWPMDLQVRQFPEPNVLT